jgi:hypothetical protein
MAHNGGGVKRYHTWPIIGEESVAKHSFEVALIVLELTEHRASANLLRAALFHDLAEYVTGDIPHPCKRDFPEIDRHSKNAEQQHDMDWGLVVELTDEEILILHWADSLQLMFFALHQRMLGNLNMGLVFSNGYSRLKTFKEHPIGRALADEMKFEFDSI